MRHRFSHCNADDAYQHVWELYSCDSFIVIDRIDGYLCPIYLSNTIILDTRLKIPRIPFPGHAYSISAVVMFSPADTLVDVKVCYSVRPIGYKQQQKTQIFKSENLFSGFIVTCMTGYILNFSFETEF